MIKVEIYETPWEFNDKEPSEILSLEEFEKNYNNMCDKGIIFNPAKIKFITE